MALSSLSAQLASLHSSNATSKDHSDAIGRGLQHSTQHSHAIHIPTNKTKFKPSVLYPDSRSAARADIPFTVLCENAIASLQFLYEHCSVSIFDTKESTPMGVVWTTLLGENSVRFERGLQSKQKNSNIDSLIKRALVALSAAGGDDAHGINNNMPFPPLPPAVNISSSILHILEYLIQKYDVHLHGAESMLVSFLPHHESLLFQRIVQLIDVATFPHWVFLRPYSTGANEVVPRTVIAKWAATTKDNGGGNVILSKLCQFGVEVIRLNVLESTSTNIEVDSSDINIGQKKLKRGSSLIVSFIAAVVVEAMTIQNSNLGTLSEGTLRCLVPFALGAVGSTKLKREKRKRTNGNINYSDTFSLGSQCHDWRAFGYIIVSTLMKHCELGVDVKKVLATEIVNGSIEVYNMHLSRNRLRDGATSHHSFVDGGSMIKMSSHSALSVQTIESTANSLLVIAFLLSSDNVKNVASTLNPSYSSLCADDETNPLSHMRCFLPQSTFRLLIKHPVLVSALGHLAQERGSVFQIVKHFLASLIVSSLGKVCGVAIDQHKNGKTSLESCKKFLMDIIEETHLRSILTEESLSLCSGMVIFILSSIVSSIEKDSPDAIQSSEESMLLVFNSIHDIDSSGCDAGIAKVLANISLSKRNDEKAIAAKKIKQFLSMTNGKEFRQELVKNEQIVGEVLATSEEGIDSNDILEELLPPIIALEHSNVSVRLHAVERLAIECSITGTCNSKSKNNIGIALIRRYASDDNSKVVFSAVKTLNKLLAKNEFSVDFWTNPSVVKDIVLGLYKWSLVGSIHYSGNEGKIRNETPEVRQTGADVKVSKKTVIADQANVLCEGLKIAGSTMIALKQIILQEEKVNPFRSDQSDDNNTIYHDLLTQGIVTHINIDRFNNNDYPDIVRRIKDAASHALMIAFGQRVTKENVQHESIKTISKSNFCLNVVDRCVGPLSPGLKSFMTIFGLSERVGYIKQRFLWEFLYSFTENLKDDIPVSSSLAQRTAINILSNYNEKETETKAFTVESSGLVNCLKACASLHRSNGFKMVNFVVDITSIRCPLAFEKVSTPVISSIIEFIDKTETVVELSTLFLLETVSQPNLNKLAVQRLLEIIKHRLSGVEGNLINSGFIGCTLVTILSLICHNDYSVRENAMDVLKVFSSLSGMQEVGQDAVQNIYSVACGSSPSMKAELLLDGAKGLPQLLCKAIESAKNGYNIRKTLLEGCVVSATSMKHFNIASTTSLGNGGCHASSMILLAMELAGETAFPLSHRWSLAGKKLISIFLMNEESKAIPSSAKTLLESVVLLLLGISTRHGDANRGVVVTNLYRQQSQSMRASDNISFVLPYPEEMTKTVTECLSHFSEKKYNGLDSQLCEATVSLVLRNPLWSKNIFPNFDAQTRKHIAIHLLTLRSVHCMESAGSALLGLPLNASDFLFLATSKKCPAVRSNSDGFLALTVLADCIRNSSLVLANDKKVIELSSILFDRLSSISEKKLTGVNGLDYTRSCLVQTLHILHENIKIIHFKERKPLNSILGLPYPKIGEHANLLVALVGGSRNFFIPLNSGKGKSTALALLACLCSLSPSSVVGSLIPALINTISCTTQASHSIKIEDIRLQTKAAGDALMAIVPVYCKCTAETGQSSLDLFNAFVKHTNKNGGMPVNQKYGLYSHLIDSFSCTGEQFGRAISSVISFFVAGEAFLLFSNNESIDEIMADEDSKEGTYSFTSRMLHRMSARDQIRTFLQTLSHAGCLISALNKNIKGSEDTMNCEKTDIPTFNILNLALRGSTSCNDSDKHTPTSYNEKDRSTLCWVAATMLKIVKRNIMSRNMKQAIKNCSDEEADLCLTLWQQLVQLKYDLSSLTTSEFVETFEMDVHDTLSTVQRLLPVPLFLASVSSLITDDDADPLLQRKSISLLAERTVDTDPLSAESNLFLDMIPNLIHLVSEHSDNKDNTKERVRGKYLSQQTSLLAIEQMARTLGLGANDKKVMMKRIESFIPVFNKIINFLISSAKKLTTESLENSHIINMQVISSASLCISTLVVLLKARCLPYLPNLVNSLLLSLPSVNEWLDSHSRSQSGNSIYQSVKYLQLSIVRALVAVVESLPQFVVPYLDVLLSPQALSSPIMRQDNVEENNMVKEMLVRFDTAVTLCPVRQLIPSLSKITINSLNKPKGRSSGFIDASCAFNIMQNAIKESSSDELGPVIGKVINAAIHVYDFECTRNDRMTLLASANETMLSLVMKISEMQLRPLFAKLKDWRGELKTLRSENTSSLRRDSFWSLTAVMSRELRSLFLPCISTVVLDAARELDFAVTMLCDTSKSLNNREQKNVEVDLTHFDKDALNPLQSVLLCLESSLKADAHEGGNWIRSEDDQRYHTILEPLGKLLQAKVPTKCNVLSSLHDDTTKSISNFQMLVQGIGTEDHGSVSGCFIALAAAAGNEQLWKPLNHSILEACGNEKRTEVRKAGVSILLSVIQALGEEYMVLLPECLPVLSELLEDEDEEIVAMAKECIHQGEELLGESLDDSLM